MNQVRSEVIRDLEKKVTALKEVNILNMGTLDMKYTKELAYKYSKYSDLEKKIAELILKQTKY